MSRTIASLIVVALATIATSALLAIRHSAYLAAPPVTTSRAAMAPHSQELFTRRALDAVSEQLEPHDYERAARFVADCDPQK